MKNYIRFPKVEGDASRQAHADLPRGTYEREMGKEGFFGPASFFYHRHPPTAWSHFEGPLRPHAFDLTKLGAAPRPCASRLKVPPGGFGTGLFAESKYAKFSAVTLSAISCPLAQVYDAPAPIAPWTRRSPELSRQKV